MTSEHFVINEHHAPFNERYLTRLDHTMKLALSYHLRTMAIVVALRFPDYHDMGDTVNNMPDMSTGVFSRFIEALNARIEAYQHRLLKAGQRIYPCHVTHAWTREYGEQGKPHYHVVLFVNNDTFRNLGRYAIEGNNLGSFIEEAWCSALKIEDVHENRKLVHFAKNGLYYIDRNATDYADAYQALSFRLSYFAKERSKYYSRQDRSFGCSQPRRFNHH
ncbi:inovirus Gp2 family protein [Lelliottia amnigena]